MRARGRVSWWLPPRAALSASRRFLPLIPPLALAVVAVAQFGLAHTAPLSPWKGGGFGMFSTQDQPRARTVRLHLLTPVGAFAVMDDGGGESLRAWPSRGALREVAAEAVCGRWRTVPLDSVGAVAAPSPAWDWVYRTRTMRRRSALAGVAVPDDDGVGVDSVRAVVVRQRLTVGADSSVIGSEVVASEVVSRAEARCSTL